MRGLLIEAELYVMETFPSDIRQVKSVEEFAVNPKLPFPDDLKTNLGHALHSTEPLKTFFCCFFNGKTRFFDNLDHVPMISSGDWI
jgi:hypothetical protein